MNTIPTRPTALKYGLYLGIAAAVYSVVLFMTNMTGNTGMSIITYALIIGAIVLSCKEYKSLTGGFMTFKQGFGLGFLTSVVGGVISSVVSFAYILMDKEAITNMVYQARMKLEENPDMTEEAIDMAMSMTEKMMTPTMILVMGIVGSMFIGAIISLIVAAIMKKDDNGIIADDDMGEV